MRRPYAVIRVFSPAAAVNHYEQILATRRVVDRDVIGSRITEARAEGYTETIVSQHATREEAEKAAAGMYAGPGEMFRAELCDVGAPATY